MFYLRVYKNKLSNSSIQFLRTTELCGVPQNTHNVELFKPAWSELYRVAKKGTLGDNFFINAYVRKTPNTVHNNFALILTI